MKLHDLIENALVLSDTGQRNSTNAWGKQCSSSVSSHVRLAVALRMLAGASYLDVQRIYGIKQTYVYTCLWQVVDAVNDAIPIYFPIDDHDGLCKIEAEFRAASTQGVWRGCVGCIDGVHFKMRAPSLSEVPNPIRYYVARKSEYALLCIAICDVNRRFLYYSMEMAATTHDSLAWNASSLGTRINQGALPFPFFFNGDNAFSLSNHMVVPSGTDTNFDFVQSSNRMAIECAFGMLVRRWGILWRSLGCAFERRAPLIGALMRLHNWCIDNNVPDDELQTAHSQGEEVAVVQPGCWRQAPKFDGDGKPVEYLDTGDLSEAPRAMHSLVRDQLMARVAELGLSRPPLPSRCVPTRKGRKTNSVWDCCENL